jgi:hypothetical protein
MARTPAALRFAYHGVERRVPASLLLITPEVGIANTVYGTLERSLGARVWLWHEPAVETAVRVLAVCRFRLVLLDLTLVEGAPEWMLPSFQQAAPETPIALLGTSAGTPAGIEQGRRGAARPLFGGAVAVVPRGDPTALARVVLQVLGIPAAMDTSNPPGDSEPVEPG